jgi:hypothetical protein
MRRMRDMIRVRSIAIARPAESCHTCILRSLCTFCLCQNGNGSRWPAGYIAWDSQVWGWGSFRCGPLSPSRSGRYPRSAGHDCASPRNGGQVPGHVPACQSRRPGHEKYGHRGPGEWSRRPYGCAVVIDAGPAPPGTVGGLRAASAPPGPIVYCETVLSLKFAT